MRMLYVYLCLCLIALASARALFSGMESVTENNNASYEYALQVFEDSKRINEMTVEAIAKSKDCDK